MSDEAKTEEKEKAPEDRAAELASQYGWNPDGELDAIEFLARGNQFHLDMKEQVSALKQDNERVYRLVAEHITSTNKRDFETAKLSIDQQIAEAKEAGDTDRAVELAEQKASLKEPDPPVDPKMQLLEDWQSKQTWWSNDRMRKDAIAFYNAEVYDLGKDDPAVILPKVEERIKEIHASYFKPENPNRDKGAGDPGGPKKPRAELDLNDLDEDERRHFDQFKSMGMDSKKLLKSIKELRAQRAV